MYEYVIPIRRAVRLTLLTSLVVHASCTGNEGESETVSDVTVNDSGARVSDAAGSRNDASRADSGSASSDSDDEGSDAPADEGSASFPPRDAGFSIPFDSNPCKTELPFHPPGCLCTPGSMAACWTGPLDKRNKGGCRDGVQYCATTGEFTTWGPCEGAVLECELEPPEPPREECGCVPGTVIGCDEDCEAFVICKPFSTKECQPDGTFGPCREALLPTGETALGGCVNLFHGCLPENPEGVFAGDCSGVYECGHPPNVLGVDWLL